MFIFPVGCSGENSATQMLVPACAYSTKCFPFAQWEQPFTWRKDHGKYFKLGEKKFSKLNSRVRWYYVSIVIVQTQEH